MRRLALSLALSLIPVMSMAQQERPGVFPDYQSYESFLVSMMAKGDVVGILDGMTDLSRLTVTQRGQFEEQMAARFPSAYTNTTVMVDEAFGEFTREIRAFWSDDAVYGFFYAYLHRLADGSVRVIHVGLGSDINEVFKSF